MENYDFSGYATRNDLLCGDGRTIRKNAFKDNDGSTVPLVWNHQHNDPDAVLGHALLENRDDGVYAYCKFNDSEAGQSAKELVRHGDVRSLSIWANKLKQIGGDVIHGTIRELSLVLAGANPGAYVDFVMEHGDEGENGVEACYDESVFIMYHSDEKDNTKTISHAEKQTKEDDKMAEEKNAGGEKTVKEVIDSMTEEQKTVMYAMIGQALEDAGVTDDEEDDDSEGGNENMKHNVFENEETNENVLSHDAMQEIINDAKRYGSMKESFLAHAGDTEYSAKTATYGIDGADSFLFPEARTLNNTPDFIKREMGWVSRVMNGVHHTPFSRIKSMFADITEDDARAKGYIKGKLKKEEVFTLLKRTTTPTTIYKKQKMDRDDVVDITDFDVIAWLKSEMRMMLDEEIARAILVGDGRLSSSDDKINEQNIRPIWKDEDLYTIKSVVTVPSGGKLAEEFIDQAVRAMKDYKGSGNPTCFMTDELLTECLLLKDTMGHRLYKSADEVATAMRVSSIVTVPVMEGLTRETTVGSKTHINTLKAIIVNLNDYNVGADKGGAINMFDDFDIDYNQQKYLIETRCSGALIKPYSAIALETSVEKANSGS